MSKFFMTPAGRSIYAFHDLAAQRGDGLHPALLEALSKSGSVSGPPARRDQNTDNVIRGSFGSQSGPVPVERKATK
ncbi:hypothetical protein [Roseibium sp.]|uniref:hypothetical protein n=1 Tax=Roseibium sp. TaxID=1936156 RepID=UPI003B512801